MWLRIKSWKLNVGGIFIFVICKYIYNWKTTIWSSKVTSIMRDIVNWHFKLTFLVMFDPHLHKRILAILACKFSTWEYFVKKLFYLENNFFLNLHFGATTVWKLNATNRTIFTSWIAARFHFCFDFDIRQCPIKIIYSNYHCGLVFFDLTKALHYVT